MASVKGTHDTCKEIPWRSLSTALFRGVCGMRPCCMSWIVKFNMTQTGSVSSTVEWLVWIFKCSYTFKIYIYPLQRAIQSRSHIFFLNVMWREPEALEGERRHTPIPIFLTTCHKNLELLWASPEHRFLSCTMRTLHGKHLVFSEIRGSTSILLTLPQQSLQCWSLVVSWGLTSTDAPSL